MDWTAWFWISTVLLVSLRFYLRSKFGRFKSKRELYGYTAIVTGANSGIGKETARGLAERGARVILACRNKQKGDAARDEIIESTSNENVIVRIVDLASLDSVRKFADEINRSENRLDILVNNAMIANQPRKRTPDGLDIALQTNHYGPFLLTNLLLDLLKRSAPSRIVFLSSLAHIWASVEMDDLRQEFGVFDNYCVGKLYNILTSNYLAEKLKDKGITSNSVYPGVAFTQVWQNVPTAPLRFFIKGLISFFQKSPAEAAETVLYLALSEEVEGVTGKYFSECKIIPASVKARNPRFAETLWRHSEKAVGIGNTNFD